MTNTTRIGWNVLIAGLALAFAGAGLADEASTPGASLAGLGDPVCEQEASDLGLWLYSLSAEADGRLSDDPLDEQLLDPDLRPLAEQLSGECSPLGWAMMRIGSAAGRDKVLWLAEYVPGAVEQCGCDLNLDALRYLLYQVSASPRLARRAARDVDPQQFGRLDREDRSQRDLVQPTDGQRLDPGPQRTRWSPRRGAHVGGE